MDVHLQSGKVHHKLVRHERRAHPLGDVIVPGCMRRGVRVKAHVPLAANAAVLVRWRAEADAAAAATAAPRDVTSAAAAATAVGWTVRRLVPLLRLLLFCLLLPACTWGGTPA